MKVAYMKEKMKIVVRDDAKVPEVLPGQVLVKIEFCGICGSDVHFYKDGRVGDVTAPADFVLGHEVAGVVAEVGEGVNGLQVGDRVALEPGYSCGKCEYCKTGRYNLCPDVVFFADPPVEGALKEYVAHPADMCFKLPDNMTTEEGALVEPLAVGFYAAQMAQAHPGQSAIVFGAGCIGLVTIMALKNRGLTRIYCADLVEKRLEMARKLGAVPICVGKDELAQRMGADAEVDLAFDTSGAASSVSSWIQLLKETQPNFLGVGGVFLFAIAGSNALSSIGFGDDLSALLAALSLPKVVMVFVVGALVVLVGGPLGGVATVMATGLVSFTALVGVGCNPAAAVAATLVWISTEGASPPSSPPIFVACSLADVKDVGKIFVPLVFHYVIPITIVGGLIALGILPLANT